jgi:hypothetical protein
MREQVRNLHFLIDFFLPEKPLKINILKASGSSRIGYFSQSSNIYKYPNVLTL